MFGIVKEFLDLDNYYIFFNMLFENDYHCLILFFELMESIKA